MKFEVCEVQTIEATRWGSAIAGFATSGAALFMAGFMLAC